jgi:hypothetical protein
MDAADLSALERTLTAEGADAAIDRLCARLRADKDYPGLFYALLMRARHNLGLNPVPTAPSADIPAQHHAAYEDAIRQAAREVGGMLIKEGNIPAAWSYYRIINEPEPVRTALETAAPAEGEDIQSLVQVAYYEGLHPRKGFDWVLTRYGICNAITTLGGQELPHSAADKHYCLQALVRSLYHELRERLAAEIERQEGKPPPEASAPPHTPGVLGGLMRGRDWLFADDQYHIDLSHLSSVVQFSLHLTPCDELRLARELCAYGARLSGRYVQPGDPPFEELYPSHDRYLAILAGENVEENLDYFRRQADEADPETVGTYPAEVLVNLLLRLERGPEALAVASKHLRRAWNQRLTCPNLIELCLKCGDFRTLAEVSREQGDAVHYLAGLVGTAGK